MFIVARAGSFHADTWEERSPNYIHAPPRFKELGSIYQHPTPTTTTMGRITRGSMRTRLQEKMVMLRKTFRAALKANEL
jgi:hypothetical protein